ncbi:hypothetical protein ABVT39_013727 [Epinephelus coioides]
MSRRILVGAQSPPAAVNRVDAAASVSHDNVLECGNEDWGALHDSDGDIQLVKSQTASRSLALSVGPAAISWSVDAGFHHRKDPLLALSTHTRPKKNNLDRSTVSVSPEAHVEEISNKCAQNLLSIIIPQSSQTVLKQRHLKLALLNTRSLNNKSLILNELIIDNFQLSTLNNLDFLCITEIWHKPLDYFSPNQITPTGFTYTDKPCPENRGGGVVAIHRKDIKITTVPIPAVNSFEHLVFKLSGPTPLVSAITC